MKYKFPNGHTIDLDKNLKNIAERYGAKPVKEDKQETKPKTKKKK